MPLTTTFAFFHEGWAWSWFCLFCTSLVYYTVIEVVGFVQLPGSYSGEPRHSSRGSKLIGSSLAGLRVCPLRYHPEWDHRAPIRCRTTEWSLARPRYAHESPLSDFFSLNIVHNCNLDQNHPNSLGDQGVLKCNWENTGQEHKAKQSIMNNKHHDRNMAFPAQTCTWWPMRLF